MDILWARLGARYGRRFWDDYGVEPNVEWANELKSVTPAEAEMGFEQLKKQRLAHPPTLDQFMGAIKDALEATKYPYRGQNADDPLIKRLHDESVSDAKRSLPPPDPEREQRLRKAEDVRLAALAEMKSILRYSKRS